MLIRALDRKLMRDLLRMKGQALAICAVIAAGVATLVMSLSALESLERNRAVYYDRYRFAEVFAHLKRAPDSVREQIEAIPGVATVQTRVVVDVTIDVEGLEEPAVGRLVSIPERGSPRLNQIYLRKGRHVEPGRHGEVLVGESFFDEHQLRLGDSIEAVINGHRESLTIVGVALSPEYVLQVREGSLLPDQKMFGVFWMGREELAAAFDMEGAFNHVCLRMMHGASEPEIHRQLDAITERYGAVGAYGRKDQLSHRYLSDEIRQLQGMGTLAPTIFLGVAAFLLNVVLSRLISTQREEIAALKAFGYSRREIGWHYIKMVILIVGIGATAGVVCGGIMGNSLATMYTRFYRFPIFDYRLEWNIAALALIVSMAAGILGAIGAVWRAVSMPPAEAMRPEPPANYRATLIERTGLQHLLSQATRMILRRLERRPFRSFVSCVGIAMSVAVLVLGSFSLDALNYMINFQFYTSQRDDMTVSFVEPTTAQGIYDIAHLPGVMQHEPIRVVPVRLRHEHYDYRLGIIGLPAESDLYRLFDDEQRLLHPPTDGLLLSDKLAEILHVRPGDTVRVEVLEGQRPVREIVVASLITDFAGTNAYLEINSLRRFLREGATLSGALLKVDPAHTQELYRTLKETPQVASVTVKKSAIKSFRETIAENLLRMRIFNVLFACVIAIGVVYNTARISLSERSRELATLRVIGFTRAEISLILLGELAILTLVALPLGMVIGYLLCWVISLGLDTEVYRIPLIIERQTYAFAATVVICATVVSGLIVRRKLDHLDLVAVLKTRE